MRHSISRAQRGFTLLEMLIVVAIILILLSFAVPSIQNTILNYRANAATAAVISQLRQARELAVSRRRNVEIDFTAPNKMQTHVWTLPGEAAVPDPPPVYLNDNIQGSLQFYVFQTLPDTPMGFGNGQAINLQQPNGAAGWSVLYTTSGAFVGAVPPASGLSGVGNSNPVNASIFLGIPTQPSSARAITVLGATGRVRNYTWSGSQWFE